MVNLNIFLKMINVNGKFVNDRGDCFPLGVTLKDENDLKKYFRPLNSLDVEDSEIIIVIKD